MKKIKSIANRILQLSHTIGIGLFLAVILLITISCRKNKLSNELCDCGDSPSEIIIGDTIYIVIPNVFTPNGDNYNERWYLDSLRLYSDAIVRVIDERLLDKKIIFESVGYNEPWDGTRNNGKKPKDGKYKFEIEVVGRKITGYVCVFGISDFEPTEQECLNKLIFRDSMDPFFW